MGRRNGRTTQKREKKRWSGRRRKIPVIIRGVESMYVWVYITIQYGLVAYVMNTTGAGIARGERGSPEKQVPDPFF